jgi:hypothetical protein
MSSITTDKVTLRILSGPDLAVTEDFEWRHFAYKVELRYQGRRAQFPWKQGEALTQAPTAADVLEAILSDCAGYDNARSFGEWAEEYGYDTDSRKAEQTWKAVERQRAKVERLLGDDYDAAVFPKDGDDVETAARRLGNV